MQGRIKRELQLVYNSKAQSHNGKRVTYLDMVRGIAIFLVVLGHSGLIDYDKNVWLSTFHLPAFFVVSGMLMQLKKEEEQVLTKVILHKIKGIMLPYLWFSAVSLLFDVIQLLRGIFTADVLKEHIMQTVTLQGYSVLWFLPVLVLAEILTLLILKLYRKVKRTIRKAMLTVITSILMAVGAFYGYHVLASCNISPLFLGEIRILTKAVIATAFISMGYLTGVCFEMINDKSKKASAKEGRFCFCPIGLVTGLILAAVNVLVVPYIQLMDINNVNIGNPLLYLGLGTLGSLGLILICKSIPNIPFITFYGQNTLIIMCTHLNFYIMNMGMVLGNKFFVPLPGPDGLQFMLGAMICTMLLELPVILFIRIFMPFMIGQRFGKKVSEVKSGKNP